MAELEAYASAKLATFSEQRRVLVTNHGTFQYLAETYDFTIAGTIIPGGSTLAEPGTSDLVDLVAAMNEAGICTIFTETTVSDDLAQTVAAEIENCAEVQILSLYSGSLGERGSGADSYLLMMRYNIDTIVSGLSE